MGNQCDSHYYNTDTGCFKIGELKLKTFDSILVNFLCLENMDRWNVEHNTKEQNLVTEFKRG